MMELNGVANLGIIVYMAKKDKKIDNEVAEKLQDQIDALERYMCALRKAYDNGEPVPTWADVRDNRHIYPNNNGEVRHPVHNESESKST